MGLRTTTNDGTPATGHPATPPAATATPPPVTPGVTAPPQAEVPAPPPPAAPPAETTPPAPLYTGMFGEAKTPEELVALARNMETRMVAMAAQTVAAPPVSTTAPPVAQPDPLEQALEGIEEKLYTDAKGAVKTITEVVRKQIRQEDAEVNQRKAAKQQWWEEFYAANPDLKPLQDVVQSVVAANPSFNSLPLPEAKKQIAVKAREFIARIRGDEGTETTVPSGGGAVIPSSQGGGQKNSQKTSAPVSFVEQVKKMQLARSH